MTPQMIPVDAIDPELGYRQWVDRFLHHINLIPTLIVTLILDEDGVLVMPGVKTQKYGPDVERVSGGGYFDNLQVVGRGVGPDMLWAALRAYLTVVSSRLGVEAPQLTPAPTGDPDRALAQADTAVRWLEDHAHTIGVTSGLADYEEPLFGLIRRAGGNAPTALRGEQGDECDLCGEAAVQITWIEGPTGEPAFGRVCAACGQDHTEGAAST